ncbi:MAG: hypothetical protein ABIR56_17120 [Polaromonas sp.]
MKFALLADIKQRIGQAQTVKNAAGCGTNRFLQKGNQWLPFSRLT